MTTNDAQPSGGRDRPVTNYGTTINDAVYAARAAHPYYASALSRLRLEADPNVPTLATSAYWVTHYNPATVATWTPAEAGAVLVHELEHLLRRHHERCGDRDPANWNVAGDAEINQRLAGLPDGAVYPESLGMPRGRTAEVYYGATNSPQPEPQPNGGGSGEGEGDGQPGAGQPGAAQCGSAAGGPTQPHERNDAANPGRGAADPDGARREVAREVVGMAPGDMPSDELRDWAESELGMDRSGWYSALATAVGHTLSSVGAPTRWRWPGRRDPRDIGGAVLPRWTGERPSCAVIIDTSSSITAGDLDMARAAGHFVGRMADAVYYGCNTYPTLYGSELPERIRGGGGTNLITGIERAIEDGAKAVVVITDCMTPWPDEPTRVPLIVGANALATHYVLGPGAGMAAYRPPEWAIVIPIIPE